MISPATDGGAPITLAEAMQFIWLEADLLDARQHAEWLALWDPDGLYVIPIDPEAEDFEDRLNYACDDHVMRSARVQRLQGKHSMSVNAAARTARTVSSFRLLESSEDRLVLRCAQHLSECRAGRERLYAASVTFELRRVQGAIRLRRKIIRLTCSTEALAGLAYLM